MQKNKYLSEKVDEFRHNPKKLWEQLKDLGYSNKSKQSGNINVKIDGKINHDPISVANKFNNFFTTVATKLVNKLSPAKKMFTTDTEIFQNFYKDKGACKNAFKFSQVSSEFILKELSKLNISKSTGLDEIPARFLKDGASILVKPVTFLINLSIELQDVPKELKVAKVKPLYKKGDRTECGNYRPVSVLCIISKILEKAIYVQMSEYLDKNNLLFQYQSGFRNLYSTETCLIHLTDYIREQTALGNYTGMMMIDLQKAFDTVDHKILCEKLYFMGFESTKWIKSYLSDREQIVNVNGVYSESMKVTCGVPQGSILGPLLFLCYINDMSIALKCKLFLYADDSGLVISDKNPNVISEKLSKELENCKNWLTDNKLSLHLGKTELILFGSRKKINKVKEFSVSFSGVKILSKKVVKYLGVFLDETLSGDKIVENIVKKTNSKLKFLYRSANFLFRATSERIYAIV